MVQKADLRQAMLNKANPPAPAIKPAPEQGSSAVATNGRRRDRHYRPGREGKTNITGFFPATVKKQLRLMAAENDTTIQALLTEALNDLFAKYSKPEIAAAQERG